MKDARKLSEIDIQNQKIMENKELNLFEAFVPVLILMGFLAYNIFFADGVMFGDYSNQYSSDWSIDSSLYRFFE